MYTEQIEECDMDTEEEVKLVLFDKTDGSIKLEVSFSYLLANIFQTLDWFQTLGWFFGRSKQFC